MRSSTIPARLLAAAILALVMCTGCSTTSSARVSEAELATLLARLREPMRDAGAWRAVGHGRVLTTQGTAEIFADDAGRFRLQVDADVRYADVHDGHTTSKLYPWGAVLDIEAREEESSLIPNWVITGYWLSPSAPVVISAAPAGRQGDIVALEVKHRDGRLPFEVTVDTKRGAPIRIKPAVGAPDVVVEMDKHRVVDGRKIPKNIRWLKYGAVIVDLEFEEPVKITPDETPWSRPEALSHASYDRHAPAQLKTFNDGRGFLFVRPVVNGTQLGWFLFDTGAPGTILGDAAVQKLGLNEVTEAHSSGVGGKQEIGIYAVDSLCVGPVCVGPAFLASMDVLQLGWQDLPIEGIVGCDVVRNAVVEYDILSSTIEFHDPSRYQLRSGTKWQHILLNEGKPVAQVRFEDSDGEFQVDTGAGGSLSITKAVVDRLDLLSDRNTRNSRVSGVGGSVGMQAGTVRWLEFGGKRYKDVSTLFAVSEQGSYGRAFPDGNIGIQLIDDFRVVFDLANKRMAFLDRLR